MTKQEITRFAGIRIAGGHGRYDEANKRDILVINRLGGPNQLVVWPDGAEDHEIEPEDIKSSEGSGGWTDEEMRAEINNH